MHNDNTRTFRHEKDYEPKTSKEVSQKTLDFFENIELICTLAGGFLFFFTLGYQIYLFLKTGSWFSFSIIDVLTYFDIIWAKQPNNWIGIWNLLNFINPSYAFSFIAMFISLRLSDWNLEQKLAMIKTKKIN